MCEGFSAYKPEAMVMAIAKINQDLKKVRERSVSNTLGLNISKCTVLNFVHKNVVQTLGERNESVSIDVGC